MIVFRLRPILSDIKELYSQPISVERFQAYITRLQAGTKGDMALPIAGYNPMAKDHLLEKIKALENLQAEQIMQEVITAFHDESAESEPREILIVLNLADDLKGGWTNYYSTDFDSKFKLNAFVERNFCAPYFWSSETYTKELIRQRTLEYMYRTVYWIRHKKPKILSEYLDQEIFVAAHVTSTTSHHATADFTALIDFYKQHKGSDDYDKIFHFFYGSAGSTNLGYKNYGLNDPVGFAYARFVALH